MRQPMLKGVLVAFGIMVGLALLPLVNIAGIPFGPFIGGYYGISFARSQSGSFMARGIRFGALLGVLVLLVSVAVATALTITLDLNLALLWLAVGVFTLYSANMGALGAMYSLLRSKG